MKRNPIYTRSISLRGLPEFIRKAGGSPERFFDAAGLDMSLIKTGDSFYDWSRACRLLEHAAKDLQLPAMGLQWAHDVPKDFLNSGPMLLLAAMTPKMRDFFNLACDYQRLHTNGVIYSFSEDPEAEYVKCVVSAHPSSPPCRQFMEHILATGFLMERHYIGEVICKRVTFQHSAPQDLSWHEKTFQCPVEFDADKTAAYINADYLDKKIGGRLSRFQPILRMYLKRRLRKDGVYDMSTSESVAQVLPTILGMGLSSAVNIAGLLEISPKKLQRLLNAEGETYSSILDAVRNDMAERLLCESDISINHLAKLLDYSSVEAFNTACQRWFGCSPRKYRMRLRDSA